MSQKLSDFSPAALVRANRANLYELFRSFEKSSSMEFSRLDGLQHWSSSFQYAWFNSILCTRDARPGDKELVDDCLAYFKARNTLEMGWCLDEGVDLAGWEALLVPLGMKLVDGPPGMSVDLNRLPETADLPAGVQINVVNDDKSLRDCADALLYGYGFPPDWKDSLIDFLFGIGLDSPYQRYVAYLDGRPVATAAVFFGQAVAGIYSVATAPEARGKGIGTAVTLEPLLAARRLGYRVGRLPASEMGYPIYRKMGFEQNFTLNSSFYTF